MLATLLTLTLEFRKFWSEFLDMTFVDSAFEIWASISLNTLGRCLDSYCWFRLERMDFSSWSLLARGTISILPTFAQLLYPLRTLWQFYTEFWLILVTIIGVRSVMIKSDGFSQGVIEISGIWVFVKADSFKCLPLSPNIGVISNNFLSLIALRFLLKFCDWLRSIFEWI